MQLARLFAAILVLSPAIARAEGEVTLRTQYYKERSTRVAQPMVDAHWMAGESEVRGHLLADAITSASPASGAAGQAFTEYRWEAGGGYTRTVGRARAGGDARFSRESDYQSMFAVLRGELDLARRNTTVGLSAGAGRDSVSNAGAQGGMSQTIEGLLHTYLAGASIAQVLSPHVIAGVGYELVYLDGFLENPYRTVTAGGTIEMERLPDRRVRHAITASVRGVVPETGSTVVAGYRLYVDDWGMLAHSPELRLIQEWRTGLAVHLRWRYHRQDQADFFRYIYDDSDPAVQPYLTDDVKLSAYDTQTFGLKVDVPLALLGLRGPQGDVRVDLLAEYVIQNNRYGNAVVGGLGVTVPVAR